KNASIEEAEQALDRFLKKKSEPLQEKDSSGELEDEKLEVEDDIKEKLKNGNKDKAKGNYSNGGKNLAPVVEEEYDGDVRS
ncbi:hypothetical protein R0K17_29685, partial [Planococcus sp. SIMBA_143]